MRNTGASPLHNVRLIVSHPDVYCPTTDESLQGDTALSGTQHSCILASQRTPVANFDVYCPVLHDSLQDNIAKALSGQQHWCFTHA